MFSQHTPQFTNSAKSSINIAHYTLRTTAVSARGGGPAISSLRAAREEEEQRWRFLPAAADVFPPLRDVFNLQLGLL